jgi:hypothetical protein
LSHNPCPANHRESFGQSRSERLLRESPNSCPKVRRHWVASRSPSLSTDVSLEVACHRAKWLACQAANSRTEPAVHILQNAVNRNWKRSAICLLTALTPSRRISIRFAPATRKRRNAIWLRKLLCKIEVLAHEPRGILRLPTYPCCAISVKQFFVVLRCKVARGEHRNRLSYAHFAHAAHSDLVSRMRGTAPDASTSASQGRWHRVMAR